MILWPILFTFNLLFAFTIFYWARIGHALKIMLLLELAIVIGCSKLLFYSLALNPIIGYIWVLVLLAITGADTAIGLSLFINYYRISNNATISKISI